MNEKQKMEGQFIAEPVVGSRYYERALEMQSQKIMRQREMLARLNGVYNRDIENAKVWEVLKFLIKVIFKKIKK